MGCFIRSIINNSSFDFSAHQFFWERGGALSPQNLRNPQEKKVVHLYCGTRAYLAHIHGVGAVLTQILRYNMPQPKNLDASKCMTK